MKRRLGSDTWKNKVTYDIVCILYRKNSELYEEIK